jgi:Common central domain of tyrosinase/Polyphenol oxidase middle domain
MEAMKKRPRLSSDVTRRDLLLGVGAAGASALFGLLRPAFAEQFGTQVTWTGYEKYEAAPLKAQAAMNSRRVVTRKSISTLSEHSDELRMFKEAVGVLRARSERSAMHPHGWAAIAAQHSLYCSGAVHGLQVHWSWLFLPWHRGFLYHLERTLAAAIGERTLALPYWDSSSDQMIPSHYWGEGNPLYDSTRLQRPEDRIPLDFMDVNACLMPRDFRTFGGYPYVSGDQEMVEGVMESAFHNNNHNWIGGNMATFWNAGYDPIFSGHHNNIDRAWAAWAAMPGHSMPEEKAWLDTVFTYSDPFGQPARMKIRDMLNTEAMGYRFDTLEFTHAAAAERCCYRLRGCRRPVAAEGDRQRAPHRPRIRDAAIHARAGQPSRGPAVRPRLPRPRQGTAGFRHHGDAVARAERRRREPQRTRHRADGTACGIREADRVRQDTGRLPGSRAAAGTAGSRRGGEAGRR